MRGNLTEAIWKLTYEEMEVLKEDNWIKDVSSKLQVYSTTRTMHTNSSCIRAQLKRFSLGI